MSTREPVTAPPRTRRASAAFGAAGLVVGIAAGVGATRASTDPHPAVTATPTPVVTVTASPSPPPGDADKFQAAVDAHIAELMEPGEQCVAYLPDNPGVPPWAHSAIARRIDESRTPASPPVLLRISATDADKDRHGGGQYVLYRWCSSPL